MQENIETKNIGNRKFIIELRFDPKVSMLDKKDCWLNKLGTVRPLILITGRLDKVKFLLEIMRIKKRQQI